MAGWALGLMFVYLALAFGVRVAVSLRTTGSTGIARFGGAPPMEVLGGGLFMAALIGGGINPALAVAEVVEPISGLDSVGLRAAGLVLCSIGIAGTFLSQLAMGSSWRIGVDESESTELVTGGVFSLVRNPIYSFMVAAWIGFAMLVPTWLSLAAIPVGALGVLIQVRWVEEPYLVASHGDAFGAYAARVGRFVPGLGRISA